MRALQGLQLPGSPGRIPRLQKVCGGGGAFLRLRL